MAWVAVAVLTVFCIAVSIPVEFARLQMVCTRAACQPEALTPANVRELGSMGLSADFFAGYRIVVELVFAVTSFAVGALIFWRKSEERMALFVAFALVTYGSLAFIDSVDNLDAVAAGNPALWGSLTLVTFMGNIFPVLFFYLFPDGTFVPRWTRVVAILLVVVGVCFHFFPDSSLSQWFRSPPGLGLGVCFIATALFSQLYRYRRVSGPVQRQQTKWVVFGTTAMVIAQAVTFLFPLQGSTHVILKLIPDTVLYLALLLIPLSIGVAILRYNLWDIDLVTNRTLVYGALTASVVLLYVLVVGGLGELLQVPGNLIISLLATGLAAVLFQPLRERLQRGVNRLMYGERDDPYAVLSRLGSRLESTLAPAAVLPAVAKTVKEALKLPYVAIQLRRQNGFETAAATGDPVDQTLEEVPLVYGGETVGRLILGPRAGDETFGPADRQLLEDLAHQIGVAVHAVRLTDEALRLSADLQRSRERLVTAREEERRRLRRDLHDGLGPQLASLTMTAEAARDLISTHPERAQELLGDLMERAQAAVSDVRHLVYALRPPALDALGLLGALRAHADHHSDGGVRVSVESPEQLPPLPAAVEVAAYRIALEAINNAERHAEAHTCVVRVAPDEVAAALRVEIVDDGRGIGEDRGTGVGLSSMRERAAELGGWCTVEALASGGTRVRAYLPCGGDPRTADDITERQAQEE
jgi:signal transduction histidine kinase